MGLVDVHVDIRYGTVLALFAKMRRMDLRRVFRGLRRPMHLDQRDHRDKQRGPGSTWKALAPSTLARYAREGKRRNRRILAKLPNSRTTILTADSLKMRSRVRWSMAHQAGAVVGHGSRLPQRQYMWISKQLIRQARHAFREALWARWAGIS